MPCFSHLQVFLNDISSIAVICLFAFVTYVLIGGVLTPQNVFVCIVLLQAIRLDMTNFFPKATQWLAESTYSLKRIQDFLTQQDMAEKRDFEKSREILDALTTDPKTPVMISLDSASFMWSAASVEEFDSHGSLVQRPEKELEAVDVSRHVLTDVTFQVKKGQVLGVCGPVGAGKSSLLNGILGELDVTSGHVAVRSKTIGYTSQSPWILSGTIKENILFGRAFEEPWFWKVIHACALDADLDQLPDHEETIVGERGVTLSGGQRARLALARALYYNADIYLLDDPLSAVDSKVGKHLFEELIRGLLKDKVSLRMSFIS